MGMFTKQDKQFLKENFATKDDLKSMETRQDKKYSTKDDLKAFATREETQSFLRQELARNEPELIRKITDNVKETLGEKIDKMHTKLDTFIGEIKARREEQTLHTQEHRDIIDRFEHIDKHLGITTAP